MVFCDCDLLVHDAQGQDHPKMQRVERLAEPMECHGESAQLDDADVIWHKRRTCWIVRRPMSAGHWTENADRDRIHMQHRTEDIPDGFSD